MPDDCHGTRRLHKFDARLHALGINTFVYKRCEQIEKRPPGSALGRSPAGKPPPNQDKGPGLPTPSPSRPFPPPPHSSPPPPLPPSHTTITTRICPPSRAHSPSPLPSHHLPDLEPTQALLSPPSRRRGCGLRRFGHLRRHRCRMVQVGIRKSSWTRSRAHAPSTASDQHFSSHHL